MSSVHAATVTSANDYPSTLRTSQNANHQVVFTTSSGISEGATVTLTFSSSFDTSSLTEDDVDVLDDGVELTTASSCAGSEKASVAIASDVLTITICAGDAGAIAAASQVTVEIGTNATSSGTGANRIVNPSSVGTYFVTIGGTFGDEGSIALPISTQNDQVAVSVAIPSMSGGGSGGGGGDTGGGGPGPGDTTAPTISGIVVSSITTSSATVTWTTSENADSAVDYGLTQSFELGAVTSSAMEGSHTISLSGLSEGKTYYFRVRSKDASNNEASSSTQSFSTLDQTAPTITSVSVVDVTQTSARITWTTSEAATSAVEYGTTVSYGLSRSSTVSVTSHSVILSALTPGTLYHFRARSADASSNATVTSDQTFTTAVDFPPANVSGLTITTGNAQLTLSWTNPSDTDLAGVRVLQCPTAFPTSQNDAACTQVLNSVATSLTRTGLTNGTTYYYGVFAYDAAGQFASGAVGSGQPTAPEEEGPPAPPEPEVPPVTPPEEPPCGTACSPSGLPDNPTVPEPTPSQPTSLGTKEAVLSRDVLGIIVGNKNIILSANQKGVTDVLAQTPVRFQVSEDELSDAVENLQISIGSQLYLMRLADQRGGNALYITDVAAPSVPQLYTLTLSVQYADQSTQSVSSYLNVLPFGQVVSVIDGEEASVEGARVTLSQIVGGKSVVWDGSPYNQFNPTTTGPEGTYGWYVSNGAYQVESSAEKLEVFHGNVFSVANNIVNARISMRPVAKQPETSATTAVETFTNSVTTVFQTPVQETLKAVQESPVANRAADFATPTLAVTAGASVVVLSVAFDFIPFLHYLFTAPFLFFWRRKRKGFGVVYNAISKAPVDLAMVRLFQVDQANPGRLRLLKSRVTDKAGRFFFLVQPGTYQIVVTKGGFLFPTAFLKETKDDGVFLDVYHKETIEVQKDDAVLTPNIPLDPLQASSQTKSKRVVWQGRLRVLQQIVAVSGVLVSVVVTIIRPSVLAVVMIGVQVLVYLLARRLARPRKPKNWGIVYDKETNRPLQNVVARIFEPRYNKLLDTQVTDARGRYAFLLGPSEYYAVFEKPGYSSAQISPIDYTHKEGSQDFSQNVGMT
ncbi:MAG: fibronectin type III domain-containing protein, partial [Patescibacteria group bacterium]